MKRRQDGDTRSIGVANFHAEHLSNIIDLSFFTPAINQIELHPLLNQAELRSINADYGIVTEAYGPLGVGRLLDNPTIAAVAQAHDKTTAQVLIRWSIQLGNVVIPRPRTGADQVEPRGVRLRADRRRDGHTQRTRRRHPIPAQSRHLHRHLSRRTGRGRRSSTSAHILYSANMHATTIADEGNSTGSTQVRLVARWLRSLCRSAAHEGLLHRRDRFRWGGETFGDTIRWMAEAGHIPRRKAGRLISPNARSVIERHGAP